MRGSGQLESSSREKNQVQEQPISVILFCRRGAESQSRFVRSVSVIVVIVSRAPPHHIVFLGCAAESKVTLPSIYFEEWRGLIFVRFVTEGSEVC